MDMITIGGVIRRLRLQKNMTQRQLADELHISDKTVSKWETGKGCPDIALLQDVAKVFQISLSELFAGVAVANTNQSANLLRASVYVCPVCGNVIFSVGQAAVSCHGIQLPALPANVPDEAHGMEIASVEDEFFLHMAHDMTRAHHISFFAAVSTDRVQLVKLYPEGNAETRVQRRGVRRIYAYCSQHGLFSVDVR